MNPLSKQVGGSHYQTKGVQHAHFCQQNQIPWCEACALKYLLRHRKKNGIQDLEKAIHYLEICRYESYKLAEVKPTDMRPSLFVVPFEHFINDNSVPDEEGWIMYLIITHQTKYGENALIEAVRLIKELIATYPAGV
jgi:hypothetical protein